MKQTSKFLAGSPYYVEKVLGIDEHERAMRGELTHLLLNQPPICDCHCRRCFMPETRRGSCENALSTKEYCTIIGEARKAGMFCLEISGEGEPLLSRSLKEVINCAHENSFITTLITNGHSLTQELVQYLFDRNVTIVVSLFSLSRQRYEMDNSLPGSFDRTLDKIRMTAGIYQKGVTACEEGEIYRMAIHTTAQADNFSEIDAIKEFCQQHRIFFSIAPLAPVGGGASMCEFSLDENEANVAINAADNTIILSSSSKNELGREVCGTCLYGLNIGYDGSLLFDAHAGYEVGDKLGNIRQTSLASLIKRQRELVPSMFRCIDGFCPVRDPKWPDFLKNFLSSGKIAEIHNKPSCFFCGTGETPMMTNELVAKL